ncbi:MAG TPA: WecB/TagA/CpsF family glycosyltransferase [Gemmatimonadaceae bacterium]|nr:WecB/TagA/CpsF family glycosyltransferase [Gemmatimonadaceae bacterium]
MINRGKQSVLGVHVDVTDYESAVERTVDAARRRSAFIVTALPVHGIMTGALDPVHRYRLNTFDLLVPDGQPVRWALNLLHGAGLRERVAGPALMLSLCERLARDRLPIYLFGSRSETIALLAKNLERRFPGIAIAGSQPGRFAVLSSSERAEIVAAIRGSGAAVTFVGLGCPRQEIWAYENRAALSMPLVCVGAAFDFHAGTVAHAPAALQRAGLEWAFRLSREPRRLWRRYAFYNPLYIGMVAAQLSGALDFDARPARAPEHDLNYG